MEHMRNEPAAAPRPPRRDRWPVALVTMSHAVQHLYAVGIALTYPAIQTTFHVSTGTLGIVLTVSGVVGGVLQGAAGLIRRASTRALLAGQGVGLAVTSALGAVAGGFPLYGAARVLSAFVYWPQHPVGSAYLSERYPERRGAILSWHTAGGSIGSLAVPLLVGAITEQWGWRWALVALAVPMALGGVLVGARLPGDRRPHGHGASGAVPTGPTGAGAASASGHGAGASPRSAPGTPPPRVPLRRALRSREALVVLAASTIAAGGRGLGTLSAYVPIYLGHSRHLRPVLIGVVFTALTAASIVGPVVAGHLSDRLGRRRMLVATYALAAVAIAAFPLVGGGLGALVPMAAVVGFLAYAESPLLQAAFSDAVEGADHRAAFGAFFAIAYGVGSVWFAALGWVIDRFGFTWAFGVMAGSFVVAGLLLLPGALRPEERRRALVRP